MIAVRLWAPERTASPTAQAEVASRANSRHTLSNAERRGMMFDSYHTTLLSGRHRDGSVMASQHQLRLAMRL